MPLKTDISYLPHHKQDELKLIVATLVPSYSEIEMIILFGSYARNSYVEDKYIEKGITYEYKSDYDLLIVLSNNKKADADSYILTVGGKLNALNLPTPVHPILHGIDFLNAELENGSYFFDDIKKEGIVLFNSTRYQLANKKEFTPKEKQEQAQLYFDNWFKLASMFFESFEANFLKGINDLDYLKVAAFELHQATERFYHCIQLVFTGYKSKTHDLEILGQSAKSFNMEFGKVFPMVTKRERERFILLKKAYIDARYNIDYKISKEDLEYLAERVKLLIVLTDNVCKEKIASFTS
jgi:uncharacterized protein